MLQFIFLSVEPALKSGILCISDGVGVVIPGTRTCNQSHNIPHLSPLQSAGPVGGGGEPVHGGTGGAPVCSDDLTPGDGGQGAGHGAASDQHLQTIRTMI